MRRRHCVFTIIAVVFFLLLRFVAEVGHEPSGTFLVTRVIDGDTAELNGQDRVRLLGIDAPEEGEPFHDSAKAYLSNLALNKQVALKFDARKRDGYGRLLAYIYLDTFSVNAAMVAMGLARIYFFTDNASNDQIQAGLLAAQRQAIGKKIGIWTVPNTGEAYYIGNSRTMRFHRPQCPSAKKLPDKYRVIFEERTEPFLEGYSPCRNCQP